MSEIQPSIQLTASTPASATADLLVIGIGKDADGLVVHCPELPVRQARELLHAAETIGFGGGPEEFLRIPAPKGYKADGIGLQGLGRLDTAALAVDDAEALESLRRAAGRALRGSTKVSDVVLALPVPSSAAITAVAEGARLGAYAYTVYQRGEHSSPTVPAESVQILVDRRDAEGKNALGRGLAIADAVNRARDLVNESPLDLYPETFAAQVVAQAKPRKVKVTVHDDAYLRQHGYGGLIGVGQGSTRPPRLVKVEYSGARGGKHLAIVGKGITFDTGGISIKPAAGMDEMKMDMGGAAAAVQAVFAIADLGLPVKATAWLALAENMPSGSAQRPGDVISIFGGRTVEVLNTDAEGRLVMADAIVAASAEKPDLLVDVATLTGAQLVALGTRVSAVMGSDAAREAVTAAAARSGEQFWPMPLPEELLPTLKSKVADLQNIGKREGGMLSAGVFLQQFVGGRDGKPTADDAERIDWAHLDIAGPAMNSGAAWGYTPAAGTGVSVRTLVAVAEDLA